MKRDSILPEKDVTSFLERCLSLQKRCYVFFGKILVFPEKILRLFKESPHSAQYKNHAVWHFSPLPLINSLSAILG